MVGDASDSVPPPDLTLFVDARQGGKYAVSVTDGQGAVRLAPEETDSFTAGGDARSTLAQFRTIRRIDDPAGRQAEADRLGLELWGKLPERLQRFYWEEMHGNDLSIVVASEEPSLPWELVKPRRSENGETGPMLGLAFSMARWTRDRPLPGSLRVSSFASIVPRYNGSPLQGAASEFRELSGKYGARSIAAELQPVKTLLAARSEHAIHYTGHGVFDPDVPDEGQLVLTDAPLRAADFAGVPIDPPGRPPLVFLNACQVGRQGGSSGSAGGWAAAFRNAGCGAFVGPYYSVTSAVASRLSQCFYEELAKDLTLGEAMRAVRHRFTSGPHFPFHPTWLAYTLHGHPNAKVQFSPGG